MAEAGRNVYRTELEGIRAPLGVILYLIRRDNLDIYDIPIARITNEYLEYLDLMEGERIDLAGEFFVLAATLLRLKAQMLLRRDEDDDDPREELVRSLVEYKKMMEAAGKLREMEDERRNIFTRPVPETEKQYPAETTIELNLFQIMRAFQEVMTAFEAADVREIELEEYTIEEKVEAIREAFKSADQVLFAGLFAGGTSRMELIVTFIALLELIKHGQVKFQQDAAFGSIYMYKAENFGNGLEAEELDSQREADVMTPVETEDKDGELESR